LFCDVQQSLMIVPHQYMSCSYPNSSVA
jgi:hypothetical protein